MYFDQPAERDGTWQIHDVAVTVSGQLTYAPTTGLTLRVHGGPELFGRTTMQPGPFTILGTIDGQAVTLLDCYPRGESTRGEVTHGTFLVSQAVLGRHVSSLRDLRCVSVRVNYTELDDWVSPVAPLVSITRSPEDRFGRFAVALTQDRDKYVAADEHAELRLNYTTTLVERHSIATIETHPHFFVTPRAPADAETFVRQYVRPLEHFITFATGRVNVVQSIEFEAADSGTAPVALLYWPIQHKGPKSQWWPHPEGRGLFSLLDVDSSFQNCLAGWLAISRRHRTICDLLFGTIYNSRQYLETRFIALVQAAEGYHRQRFGANRRGVRLRDRLNELSTRFGPLVPGVWEPGERESFAKACADARNVFAHHLSPTNPVEPLRLHRFNEYILQLFGVALMSDMGFENSQIERLMRRGPTLDRA